MLFDWEIQNFVKISFFFLLRDCDTRLVVGCNFFRIFKPPLPSHVKLKVIILLFYWFSWKRIALCCFNITCWMKFEILKHISSNEKFPGKKNRRCVNGFSTFLNSNYVHNIHFTRPIFNRYFSWSRGKNVAKNHKIVMPSDNFGLLVYVYSYLEGISQTWKYVMAKKARGGVSVAWEKEKSIWSKTYQKVINTKL